LVEYPKIFVKLYSDFIVAKPSATQDVKAVPINHGPKSNVDFKAEFYGIDLNDLADTDFEVIHAALHKHKLLIFKGQPEISTPQNQYGLTRSIDLEEKTGDFPRKRGLFFFYPTSPYPSF